GHRHEILFTANAEHRARDPDIHRARINDERLIRTGSDFEVRLAVQQFDATALSVVAHDELGGNIHLDDRAVWQQFGALLATGRRVAHDMGWRFQYLSIHKHAADNRCGTDRTRTHQPTPAHHSA